MPSGNPDRQFVHGAAKIVTAHTCCGARYLPWLSKAFVSYRPLPLAQLACPATGSARIAPPFGIVTLYKPIRSYAASTH